MKQIKRKIKTAITKPKTIGIKLLNIISPILSDKLYLRLLFPLRTGYKLNLDNPQTYNEKLQWLKLYYRKPELSKLVDKYEVKKYVADKIGGEYIIPTYGVWDSFDEIDFDKLPNKFVLKTTHDQGGVVICMDKKNFNYKNARKKLTHHLKRVHTYSKSKEWVYKNVKPRILAEEYMIDSSQGELYDYKFFCFDGKVKAMFVATDRQKEGEEVKFNYFDVDFIPLALSQKHPKSLKKIDKPKTFDLMKEKSEILAEGHPHLRVDFYEIEEKLYFGELTFFHHAGFVPFNPPEWDYKMGSWIDLNKIK